MKKLFIVAVSCLFFTNIFAQLNPQGLANDELRAIFGHLDLPPTDTKHFLYDMSAHTVDEIFFSNFCGEQSSTDNWFLLYEEMYNAAYDVTLWETAEDIFDNVYQDPSGRIPIGVMDFDYYRLKEDALTTPIYFDFDLQNNRLIDKMGRPGYPYDEYNLFSAAPLVQSSFLSDVTFSIGPHIYKDSYNAPYYGNSYTLRINFDDGNGWIPFYNPVDEDYTVNYTVIGDKNIEVAIYDDGGNMIKYSRSLFNVGSTHVSPTPDMVINNVPGLEADVYYNCTNTSGELNKLLIYVEGYEILDFMKAFPVYESSKSADDYKEMLEEPQVIQLQNFGYDIVMVDFGSTGNAIHDNAMSLIALIEELKCRTMNNDHQFVIMGHSMGGVISKYALAHMEQFPPGPQSCAQDRGHNTRLLITNDSPHQGANIPLSLQHLYRIGFNALAGVSVVDRKIAEEYNVMLDSKGVKDMLIYHVDTRTPNGEYTHHQRRADFLDDFSNLANNGYPEHCKLMALSNGSMGDKDQTRFSDGGFRTANDKLLDMSGSVYLRILGIKVLGTDASFVLRTNPHFVTGDLLDASVDAWHLKVRFFLFGVTLTKTKYTLYNHNITASNIRSFCTKAGGIYKFDRLKGKASENSFSCPPFGSFKYDNSGTGNMDIELSIGSPWLANSNLSFSLTSDGLYWNFIHVASALDYTPGPMMMDIENETGYQYSPAATGFDIIAGIPTGWAGFAPNDGAIYNRSHRLVRNEEVANHQSCPEFTNGNPHYIRLINQEVGEDVLYLENMDLDRMGMFEAQHDVYVNYRNPYYRYQSGGFGLFRSLYSKDDCFEITGTGMGIFKYDAANSPTGIGYHVNTNSCPSPNPNMLIDEPLEICCIDYAEERLEEEIVIEKSSLEEERLTLSLFPNPTRDGAFTINMDWVSGNQAEIRITDLMGNNVYVHTLTGLVPGESVNFEMDSQVRGKLSAGIYFISVSDNKEKVTKKLLSVK